MGWRYPRNRFLAVLRIAPSLLLAYHFRNTAHSLKLPAYSARKKPQRKLDVIQLPLLDFGENQQREVSS